MSIATRPRVAIVYDDRARPETTGGYCRRAMEQLADVTHLLPRPEDGESAEEGAVYCLIGASGYRSGDWPKDGLLCQNCLSFVIKGSKLTR
jgi:hypothetical protein